MLKIGLSIPSIMASEDGSVFVRSGVLRSPFVITRTQAAGDQSSALSADGSSLTFYAADTPRFNGSAQRLLIEGPRTNRVMQPIAVASATGAWGQFGGTATPSITRDYAIAPDGTQTAARVRWVGPNAGSVSLRVPLSGANVSASHVVSFYVFTRSLGGATSVNVDVMDGSEQNLVAQFTVNQWVRAVSPVVTSGLSAASQWADIVFVGFTTGEIDFDLWVVQAEEASFASSNIIPPSATPGASTRGVDIVGASLSSLGIPANGACTVLWSGVIPNFIAGGVHTIACLDDGSVNNRFTMRFDQASGQLQSMRALAGASATANAGAITAGVPFKGGMNIDGAGRAGVSLNGAAVAAVTGGPISGLTQFGLGNIFDASTPMFGGTARLRILPYVPDATLQSLVSTL